MKRELNSEERRIQENAQHLLHWNRWGSYLSARQWGTVREDYSSDGNAWEYFPHEHARSRAYRWGEDGLGGFCDRHGLICFALALWNGHDPILKERLFGVTNPQGNHGEDVKEYYFYLDNTPTHSYMKWLYKYPQRAFPYTQLIQENQHRTRDDAEFELLNTGLFEDNYYFDILAEYAKATPEDICIRITITNRAPEMAEVDILPMLWFRNTWSWDSTLPKPQLWAAGNNIIQLEHKTYGTRWLFCKQDTTLLFTENETNFEQIWGFPNPSPYRKDAFHRWVIRGDRTAVNPLKTGTKAAAYYHLTLQAEESQTIHLRFTDHCLDAPFNSEFESVFEQRLAEANVFFNALNPNLTESDRIIQRQAFAGLLWCKQHYYYDVRTWLQGDPHQPIPPASRLTGRNTEWPTFYADSVLSMPDDWEYPWFAAWDLSFHCVAFALIDPTFAKSQLLLLTREWYMHPNGELPAYEWAFSDVNPPVQAWAALQVYQMEMQQTGKGDRVFLEIMFQKLLLNFTWWVNREDRNGRNVFQGGFLGLDNIGVFDRSKPLPTGGYLNQADGTAWMAKYCLDMLAIALLLAQDNPAYGDMAIKFFEHFLYIADAFDNVGSSDISLWDEEDGFYYDVLELPDGQAFPLKVRSTVGLLVLCAIATMDWHTLDRIPGLKERAQWFLDNRPDLAQKVAFMESDGVGQQVLLSIINRERLQRILVRVLDETEFLSPYGIRSMSRYHKDHPFVFKWKDDLYRVGYQSADSIIEEFGGNSNWRGPIWFPVNFLLIESLQKLHHYYGNTFRVQYPTGSSNWLTLQEVATTLSKQLISLFQWNKSDSPQETLHQYRPVYAPDSPFNQDPHWCDLILFYEYFDGDTGIGLGASHQTGWTALVANLIQKINGP